MTSVFKPQEREDDRSAYRWVILALCFIVLTTSFLVRVAWSNVAPTVSEELDLSPTALGSFVTAFFTGYVVTNALSGFVTDRIGARRVICVALLPLALLTGGFGLTESYASGLLVQLGMGLCAGVNFAATTKLAAGWFPPRERGLVFGVLTAAVSTAVLLSNSLLPSVIDSYSWSHAYYLLASVVLAVMVLAVLFIREPNAGASGANGSGPSPAPEGMLATIRRLFADRDYLLLGIAWFGGLWGTWGVTFWANTLMVQAHGLSTAAAGGVTALFATGGLIAKPLYGLLSDLAPVRRKFMLAPCLVAFAATLVVFGAAETAAQFRLIAPVLGVFGFAYTAVTAAMLTEIIGERSVGAASGVMNALIQTSTIIGPLVVGFAFGATGSFMWTFATLAAGPLIGAVGALMIREPARSRIEPARG